MNLTIAQLRALVATVDRGSFTTAAADLGISQSAISHAIAGLERELGSPVLERRAPVVPTPAGERVVAHAHAVLAAMEALEAAVRPGTDTGSVRLAAPPTVCQGLLPRLLALWSARLPDVDVHVFEGDDDELPEWLESGAVDVAVLVDPDQAPDDAVEVARDEMAAVVRRDHPLSRTASLPLTELHEDGLVIGGGGCEHQIERMHTLAGVPFQYAHRVREVNTVLGMVQRGLGVSIMPTLGRGLVPNDLVMVPMTPRLERRLVLSGPATRPWHPLARALVNAL